MCQVAHSETYRELARKTAETEEPQSGHVWNKLVLDENGCLEEMWEFDCDAYTVGIVGLAHEGIPKALPVVCLALFTPVLQSIAFYKIFAYLQTEQDDCDEARQSHVGPLVKLLCFVLMFLQLSNEALEGFYKTVFSLRGFNGTYSNATPIGYIGGVMLGSLQLQVAVSTISLSMLLVSHAESCLEAFMNCVALSFVLEIDNMLMDCRLLPLGRYDRRVTVQRADSIEGLPDRPAPWNLLMLSTLNISVLSFFPLCVPVFEFAGVVVDWFAGLRPLACLFMAINFAAWLGGRRWGATGASFLIGFATQAMMYTQFLYHYFTGDNILDELLIMPLFLFSFLAPAAGLAVDFNPFRTMTCPIQVPLLIVLSIGSGVMWMDQLHHRARECS